MKKGFSTFLVFSLFALIVIVVILLMPIPHYYSDGTTAPGPSFLAQMLGEKSEGVAMTTVYYENMTSRVESPYSLTCQTDLDCQTIAVRNQCTLYCGNNDPANQNVTEQLERNRVCDPAGFKIEDLNCRCILGSCTDLK